MGQKSARKSYAHILAIIGCLIGLSGFNSEIARLDADYVEVWTTPSAATSLDFEYEADEGLTSNQEDIVEELVDEQIKEEVPEALGYLVYFPYAIMTLVGLLGLLGFRNWGRNLAFMCLGLSVGLLTASVATDVVLPKFLEAMAPERVEAKVETGAAVSRMMTGSILAFVASLVGLIRPDRRGE